MKNENFVEIMRGIRISLTFKKPFFNLEEAALYLGVTQSYLYKLTHYNKIKYYRSKGGKLIYFKKADLIKWMCFQEVKPLEELSQITSKQNQAK